MTVNKSSQYQAAQRKGPSLGRTTMRMAKKPKMAKVMKEFKMGDLHSGSKTGPKVTNRKQAIAIGLNQSRKAGEGGMKMKRTANRSMSDEAMLKKKRMPM